MTDNVDWGNLRGQGSLWIGGLGEGPYPQVRIQLEITRLQRIILDLYHSKKEEDRRRKDQCKEQIDLLRRLLLASFIPYQNRTQWLKKQRCYNCHRFGHLKRTCWKLRRCFLCWELGHIARNCPLWWWGRGKNLTCFRCNMLGHTANTCTSS